MSGSNARKSGSTSRRLAVTVKVEAETSPIRRSPMVRMEVVLAKAAAPGKAKAPPGSALASVEAAAGISLAVAETCQLCRDYSPPF